MKQSAHLLRATAIALVFGALTFGATADEAAGPQGSSVTSPPGPSVRKTAPAERTRAPARSGWSWAIPTPEESRAALREPIPTQPSLGDVAANAPPPSSTTGVGMGNGAPAPFGPIGSIGQTIPAKIFPRNDILDRTPIMAFPRLTNDAERQRIYKAVMAEKTAAAPGAESLTPSGQLSTAQALEAMHPLPDSLRDIAEVQRFKYVKAQDKVLLVEPATRVVVDEIEG